jgi:hypothetical protein
MTMHPPQMLHLKWRACWRWPRSQITADIATTHAEAMRWATGRIRENPACTQIQEGHAR